jgi:2-oxoglutarate dehydrogenase E2 component (dihydrolipoamide succinyltransferase)
MATDIKAPQFPESVEDGTVATWHKQEGEAVKRDELIVDIETDKVVLEVVAPKDGVIGKIIKQEGDTVEGQEVLGTLEEGSGSGGGGKKADEADKDDSAAGKKSEERKDEDKQEKPADKKAAQKSDADTGKQKKADDEQKKPSGGQSSPASEKQDSMAHADDSGTTAMGPAVRKMVSEHDIDATQLRGTGPGGRITKEDVQQAIARKQEQKARQQEPEPRAPQQPAHAELPGVPGEREERRVPMTRLRKRIAERLVDAQQTAAMLTTFNEVNMKPIMDMRRNYKEQFEKAHGVRLGFMGFFVRAICEALKRFPAVNASIDGDDIVYHGYYDIGVAVSTERGLVVPILRDADQKGLGEVESQIIEYGKKAQEGKLSIDEMTGGTFTVSNGGVFGSLLSTPIVNPPQTAILGMHTIQERPMAVDGKVEILPMMYLALSYDHRLIDGKEAVQFLVAIKQFIEDPARLLLDI